MLAECPSGIMFDIESNDVYYIEFIHMLFYFQVFYLFIYGTFVCAQKVSSKKKVRNRTVTLSDRGVIVGGFLF